MADDVQFQTTTSAYPQSDMLVAADEVGGKKYQRIKVAWGVDGTVNETNSALPFPVTLYGPAGEVLIGADDSTFTPGTSLVLPVAFLADETATDSVDEGDRGIARMTLNRIQRVVPSLFNATEGAESARSIGGVSATAPDTGVQAIAGGMFTLSLTAAAPTPTGTDITNTSAGAIVGSDLAIRDTSYHTFVIPMAGWRRLVLGLDTFIAQFDQALNLLLYGSTLASGGVGLVRIGFWTIPTATVLGFAIGTGAVGQGGNAGGATATDQYWYNVPALDAAFPYIVLLIGGAVGNPTAGSLRLRVTRSRF